MWDGATSYIIVIVDRCGQKPVMLFAKMTKRPLREIPKQVFLEMRLGTRTLIAGFADGEEDEKHEEEDQDEETPQQGEGDDEQIEQEEFELDSGCFDEMGNLVEEIPETEEDEEQYEEQQEPAEPSNRAVDVRWQTVGQHEFDTDALYPAFGLRESMRMIKEKPEERNPRAEPMVESPIELRGPLVEFPRGAEGPEKTWS